LEISPQVKLVCTALLKSKCRVRAFSEFLGGTSSSNKQAQFLFGEQNRSADASPISTEGKPLDAFTG
jgi:hypothetical protein